MSHTRTLTAAFALGRLAFGAGLIARPERVAAGWIGEDAQRPPVKIAVRAVGARDVALAAGMLTGLGRCDTLVPWLAGGVASDMCDVVATLMTPAALLPPRARWGTVALAGGSALAGVALLATRAR